MRKLDFACPRQGANNPYHLVQWQCISMRSHCPSPTC